MMRTGIWNPNDVEWFRLLHQRYQNFAENTAGRGSRARDEEGCLPHIIPKIIHHIWLGGCLPERFQAYRDTWRTFHPGWEMILWGDEDIENFGLVNKDQYDKASNYGEKSDIARYEILLRYGGLYVDTDFECLASFDPFHIVCGFFAGISNTATIEINNGLIGSVPNHPILLEIVEKLGANFVTTEEKEPARPSFDVATATLQNPVALLSSLGMASAFLEKDDEQSVNKIIKNETSTQTIERTGPGFFTRAVMFHLQECKMCIYFSQCHDSDSSNALNINSEKTDDRECPQNHPVIILPPLFFFPMPNTCSGMDHTIGSLTSALDVSDQDFVYAFHHWAKSWEI